MTRRRPVLAAALLAATMALAAPTPSATAAPSAMAQAWQNEVIYLIMTDRFYNGDRTNDFKVRPNDPHGFHGGDLEGVIQKLDYIKDLGATAIWLTPIVDNQDNAFLDKYWGYHGYWIQDFEKVEEHLGTEATYKRLVDEAHKRGLKVIMDVVANHVGYDAPVLKDESFKDWFHHNGSIENWEDPYENENFDLAGLPDFNTENKEVLEFHEEVWGDWIKRTGLDGFRIDTVRHVSRPFWVRFNETMHKTGGKQFLLLGEVSYHTPGELAPYMTEAKFDSLFDFPLSFTLVDVFAKGQSMRLLDQRLKEDGTYPDASMLATFLDNHDYPRFLTVAGGDERKLKLALTALMTLRGIPTVYYGTEVAMKGEKDPDNRRDMAWGTNPAMQAFTKKLIAMRKAIAPLRTGETQPLFVDDHVFAFARKAGNDMAMVFLNNSDQPRSVTVALPAGTTIRERAVLRDQLSGDRFRVTGGRISVRIPAYGAQVITR